MYSSVRPARSSRGTPSAANSSGEIADAHADHQSSMRDLVDARQLLGEQHRLVQRQFDDARGDGDRRRVRGRQREGDDGVEERDLGSDPVIGWLRVRQHDVLARPQRVDAGRLGVLRHPHERFGIAARPVVDRVQPELHGRTMNAASATPSISRRVHLRAVRFYKRSGRRRVSLRCFFF